MISPENTDLQAKDDSHAKEIAARDARIARLEEAVRAMLAHSCVADAHPEDKFPEDHEAERKARAALQDGGKG